MKGISIMVAPNGARLTKTQCPHVPITIDETARAAKECYAAGASAVHAHIRDRDGGHLLDAGVYRELIEEIKTRAPGMMVQITTESAGKYDANEQRRIAKQTRHNEISAALREMTADNDETAASGFYHWAAEAGVRIQHILYAPAEVHKLAAMIQRGAIKVGDGLFVLFVLGDHEGRAATPEYVLPFLAAMKAAGLTMTEDDGLAADVKGGDSAAMMKDAPLAAKVMVCAFGLGETDCLLAAARMGMHCRAGFENNHRNENGKPATGNAERITALRQTLQKADIRLDLP